MLQESEVLRIGAAYPVKVDVRIIAATHCDLQSAVEQGAFRRDLFYRLNVISLTIPALRERQSDIPDLVNTFIRTLCQRLNKLPPQVSPEAMNALEDWHWPGNVRELENLVERIVNLCQSHIIDLADLPPAMVTRSDAENSTSASSLLQDNERACILQTLRDQGGNMRQSAKLLGISRTALYNKLNQWNIAIDTLRQ